MKIRNPLLEEHYAFCSNKLDVQETSFSFAQFNRIRNHFLGLGNVSRVSDRSGQPDNDVHKHHKSQKKINVMENIDSVPSNVQSSRQEALLYVFEDNEAVIKMIIKRKESYNETCFQDSPSCS